MSNSAASIAPVWRRLAALLYDSFILLALSFCYGALTTFLGAVLGLAAGDYQPMFQHWLFGAGWLATLMGFYYWFWRKSGQTIGMRTWHIALRDAEDAAQNPTRRQSFLRLIVAPPLILLGGLAYWSSFFDTRRHCLHDRLSGTQVIMVSTKK